MWGQTYAVPSFTIYYGDGMGGLIIGRISLRTAEFVCNHCG